MKRPPGVCRGLSEIQAYVKIALKRLCSWRIGRFTVRSLPRGPFMFQRSTIGTREGADYKGRTTS